MATLQARGLYSLVPNIPTTGEVWSTINNALVIALDSISTPFPPAPMAASTSSQSADPSTIFRSLGWRLLVAGRKRGLANTRSYTSSTLAHYQFTHAQLAKVTRSTSTVANPIEDSPLFFVGQSPMLRCLLYLTFWHISTKLWSLEGTTASIRYIIYSRFPHEPAWVPSILGLGRSEASGP